jgi:pimeloyl-ACP methyl ester carboxylesterase
MWLDRGSRDRNGPEANVIHSNAIRADMGRRHPNVFINLPAARRQETNRPLHHVEAGKGETVLMLHGSVGTSALWRQTVPTLQMLYRTVTPDLIGYGRSPAWPAETPYGIDSEMRALEPLLPSRAQKYHLVGHSYGGVVALMLALANPARVRTLTLIEPVFVAALWYDGQDASLRRFREVRDAYLAALASDGPEAAMRPFIDFWAGAGAWERASAAQRSALLQSADKLTLDWRAAFAAGADLDRLAALGPRTLLLRGDRSPKPMLRLVDALHRLMPASTRVVVPGAGHALPATHAFEMTQAILGHFHVDAERRLR